MQIIGPYLEDSTPVQFAQLLEQALGASCRQCFRARRFRCSFRGYRELVLIVKLAVAMATRSHFSKAAIRVPLRNPVERTRK